MRSLTLLAAAACLAGTMGAAQAETKWRMATTVSEGSFNYVNFSEAFADNVKDLTNGELTIEVYAAGLLAPAFKVHEAVQDGIAEAGNTAPTYITNLDPLNAVFGGFPGGMGPEGTLTWLYEDGGLELLQKFRREKMGLHSLIVGLGPSEILAHSNVPIRKLDDFVGLKYRTSGLFADVLTELGAVPTVVPGTELYTLLERKGVDAMEWSTPGSNLGEGFHNITKYIVIPGVNQPSWLWEMVVKAETWDALPENIRTQVEAAAKLTTMEALPKFYAADLKAMDAYRENGNEVIELEEDVVQAISDLGRKRILQLAEERKAAGEPLLAEVMDSYFAFKDLWARNSSYSIRD